MLRIKALVIGGGPAGSTAARFLAAMGLDTILVEKNPSFVKPCGGAIPSTGFNELGLPGEAVRKEIKKIKIIPPEGNAIEIALKGGYLTIVKRGEFDSLLRREAEKSGAQMIEGEFRRFEEIGKQLIVNVSIDGKEEHIMTDYLIAADGVNSRVRLALGLKLPYSLYTISEKIKDIDVDSCEFWFGSSHAPKSYSWVFPDGEGISAGTGNSEPRGLKDLLQTFYRRRGLSSNSGMRMYKIPLWDGELYNINNIFFIGDAAGHVMSLTYEGIYYAMKAGEFAARAVAAGKPSEYKRLWKKRFFNHFFVMKKLANYFLGSDSSAEKLVAFFRRQEVQDVSMRLWLEKSSDKKNLISFINFFRRILN